MSYLNRTCTACDVKTRSFTMELRQCNGKARTDIFVTYFLRRTIYVTLRFTCILYCVILNYFKVHIYLKSVKDRVIFVKENSQLCDIS